MKKLNISIFLTALLCMAGARTFSHDIEVANADGVAIYYVWANNKTELSVNFQGTYSSYSNKYSGNVVIPESVTYKVNSYSVTTIDDYIFAS